MVLSLVDLYVSPIDRNFMASSETISRVISFCLIVGLLFPCRVEFKPIRELPY